MEDDVAEYLRAGADMILSKPMKINQLELLLEYVQRFGTLSNPTMRLKDVGGILELHTFDADF